MKKTISFCCRSLIAYLMFSAHLACAAPGVVIEAEERLASDEEGKVRKSTIRITKTALRMDGVRGRNLGAVIYLAQPEEFLLLDKKNQTYRRLSRQTVDSALSKAQLALSKLREKARELVPDKSGEVNALLDAGLGALQKAADAEGAAPLVYRHVAANVPVGERATVKYVGFRDGEKVAEIFTVPADSLGVPRAELHLLEDVRGFFDGSVGKLTGVKANGALFPAIGTGNPDDYAGMPVRRIRYDDGVAVADWVLKEIRVEEIPDAMFAIPEDYIEKKVGLSLD